MNPPIRILIADDHPIFRRGLANVLQDDPGVCVVREAADGEEAVAAALELRPDVVILDIRMPRLTGLQAVRRLRDAGFDGRFILLTMHEDEELFFQSIQLGVGAYVLKENAVEDLRHAVHSVVAGRMFVSASLASLLARRSERQASLAKENPGLGLLTPAERRVLALIASDRTTKEIADALGISVRTVDAHRHHMSQKLGLSGSHSLLKFAYDNKERLPPLKGA